MTPVGVQSNDYMDELTSQNEVVYCTDIQADSCGYLEGEEQLDDSIITGDISDRDDDDEDDDDDDQTSKIISFFFLFGIDLMILLVWPTPLCVSKFEDIDLDNDSLEEQHKELESLL